LLVMAESTKESFLIANEYQSLLIALVSISVIFLYRIFFCNDRPSITMQETPRNKKMVDSCSLLKEDYRYPFWGGSGHLQTLYAGGARFSKLPNYYREELDTPDGDVIVLDWMNYNAPQNTPTIIIVPGICSHSESHYIRSLSQLCADNHYRSVVFNARGCVKVRTPKLFTYGDTTDLRQTVAHVHKIFPQSPLIGIGLSLGGNMVSKYAAEESSEKSQYLRGVMSISQGYDAIKGIKLIKEAKFYDRHVTRKLTNLVKKHEHMFKDVVDVSTVLSVKSVEDFDIQFTCKIHGISDVRKYYEEHSCLPLLPKVSIPILLLNALDDPLVSASLIPFDLPKENDNIIVVTTKAGGHISWCEGWLFPKKIHWHERLFLQFVQAVVKFEKEE